MNEQIGNPHSIPLEILMTDLPKGTIIWIGSCLGVSETFGTDDFHTDSFRTFYCLYQITFFSISFGFSMIYFYVTIIALGFVSRLAIKYVECEHILYDFRLCKRVVSTFLWAMTDWNKCVRTKGNFLQRL